MTVLLEADIILFFGRFHSLVVHLPIGFITLAFVFELISWKNKISLDQAIEYGLITGVLFGTVAIILGLMLASDGGYNEEVLNTHKLAGISTTLIALIAFFLKINIRKNRIFKKVYHFILIITIILLSVTGHYGGNLTHGTNYLFEYAPNSIRTLAGYSPSRERITTLDSAKVFEDVVLYTFERKCNICHNNDKFKGELILADMKSILQGGESGPVIVTGSPSESELIRRILLDPNHDDFMPSEGRTPLTKEEIELIKWWIEKGTPFEARVIDLNPSARIIAYLKEIGIGVESSFLESLNVPASAPEILNSLTKNGFTVHVIAGESSFLDVSYSAFNATRLSELILSDLLKVKDQITWLTLSGNPLQDDWMQIVSQLPNLTRLRIDKTNITNEGIRYLVNLKHLEYLNIYGTGVNDKSIGNLSQLSELKKLFVWQTDITEDGVARLSETLPELEIVLGE